MAVGRQDEAGSAQAEALQVLVLVSLGMAAALLALGMVLAEDFALRDGLLALPFP